MLPDDISETVRLTLREDIGAGDLTAILIPETAIDSARAITREDMIVCGTAWFDETYRQLDTSVQIDWQVRDGDQIAAQQILCQLKGPSQALLTGERTALNFLQLLSGTATTARQYADAVVGTGAKVLDTRKTLPGLRKAQKYAVTCGDCYNHRLGLYDAILIKENHLRAGKSLAAVLEQARQTAPTGTMIEVEVETLEQLREALAAGAGRLLLDNFDIASLKAAVRETAGRAQLEASGGVNLENIRAIAETGVDTISVGALTKDVRAVDLSMRFE